METKEETKDEVKDGQIIDEIVISENPEDNKGRNFYVS